MQVIEVAPDESYYGGCNQWYYGIWNARGKFNPHEFNPVKDINPEKMKNQIDQKNLNYLNNHKNLLAILIKNLIEKIDRRIYEN